MTVLDLTYTVDKTCPLCKQTFQATRVRSKLRTIKQETDFNTIYEQVNPLYYSVWFCPECGYAAPEGVFADILDRQAEKLKAFLSKCEVKINFPGTRSREQAIITYKLAIFYSEIIEAKNSRLAGLYLRLGWLYREAEDHDMEQMALEKALEYFELATYKESFPIGNMNEVMVDYLMAQLQMRTGKYDKAAAGFSRVISNPQAKTEKRIMEMARDAWSEIKDKRKGSSE